MPLTLARLRCRSGVEAEEIAFYRDAEFDALVEWSEAGRFLVAYAATDRLELTMLCADTPPVLRPQFANLPLIAAGLVSVEMSVVVPLRIAAAPMPAAGRQPYFDSRD